MKSTLLIALVAIPWGNTTLDVDAIWYAPDIVVETLLATGQARRATSEEVRAHLTDVLSRNPTSDELGVLLARFGLPVPKLKSERSEALTTYLASLSEAA